MTCGFGLFWFKPEAIEDSEQRVCDDAPSYSVSLSFKNVIKKNLLYVYLNLLL